MRREPLVASHFVDAGPRDDQLGAFREHEPLLLRVLRGRHDVPHLDSERPELPPEHLLRRRREPLAVAAIHLRPRALLERVRRRRGGLARRRRRGERAPRRRRRSGRRGRRGKRGERGGGAKDRRNVRRGFARRARRRRRVGAGGSGGGVFRLVFSLARHALELRQVAHLGPLAAGIARARRVHGDGVGGADDEEHAAGGRVFFLHVQDGRPCDLSRGNLRPRRAVQHAPHGERVRVSALVLDASGEGGVLRAAARGGIVCQAHEPGVAVDEICGI